MEKNVPLLLASVRAMSGSCIREFDIFRANPPDGSSLARLTDAPGCDAEATYDFSGSGRIVYTSIESGDLEVWTMDSDGSDKKQLTEKRIIFCSNLGSETGRGFDLWAINIDGTDVEQITFYQGFDGFPIFSPDRKYFVFCSNRNNVKEGETNIFICEWVD